MHRRSFLTLAGAGLLDAVLVACGSASKVRSGTSAPASTPPSSTSAVPPSSHPSSSAPAKPTPTPVGSIRGSGAPVHVRLYQNDGDTFGVGLPIIAYLSDSITDAKTFAAATTVKVDGVAVGGAWYFQKSAIYAGYPLEAHYRTEKYWPAHAAITLDLPLKGLTAGPGLVFDNNLTLSMKTGPANLTTVDGSTHLMHVTSDGVAKFTFPVSLGKAATPTFYGTKVIMEKDRVERMVGTTPGDEYDLEVPNSCRLTNSGEFIHSASWNGGNIGIRSTSNGCTNLRPDDAAQYFAFAQVGDVATYTRTDGPQMPVWDGYGDWNLSWPAWKQGGLLATS